MRPFSIRPESTLLEERCYTLSLADPQLSPAEARVVVMTWLRDLKVSRAFSALGMRVGASRCIHPPGFYRIQFH